MLGWFGFILFYREIPGGVFLGSGDDSWEGRGDVIFLGFVLSSGWSVELANKGRGEKIFLVELEEI